MTVGFRKTGNFFYIFLVRVILTAENVSDDGKAQSIFSAHIKLVVQKL